MQERPPSRVTSKPANLKRCTVRWEGIHETAVAAETNNNTEADASSNGDVEFCLDLSFGETDIEPLFSGGCWAGTVVWDASLLLSDYLIQHRDTLLRYTDADGDAVCPPRVVELGAGVGVPGMTAALLGAEVLLTEQDPLYSLLGRNVEVNEKSFQNGESKCPSHDELDWNDAKLGRTVLLRNWGKAVTVDSNTKEDTTNKTLNEESTKPGLEGHDEATNVVASDNDNNETPAVQVVLISDCIYEHLYGESWKLLARVVECLCDENTIVLNSVERRNADGVDKFGELMNELGFVNELIVECIGETGEALELYRLARKPIL